MLTKTIIRKGLPLHTPSVSQNPPGLLRQPFGTLPPEYHPGKTLANTPTSGLRTAGVCDQEDQDRGDKRWTGQNIWYLGKYMD